MNNEIFIEAGKQLTLEEYVSVATHTMSLIGVAAEGTNDITTPFSVADISVLLNKVCVYMPGRFEVRHLPACYCQIVFEPRVLNEAEFDEEYVSNELANIQDREQVRLWITEKVLFAFMDRNLHSIAAAIYFYLGYLMIDNEAFALSHNISFEGILESCCGFPDDLHLKHQTVLMRALADLEDAGLIKWNAKSGTFQLLHITPYDPNQKV